MTKAFSVGHVIGEGFTAFRKNFIPVFLICMLSAVPSALSNVMAGNIGAQFGFSILSIIMAFFIQGVMVFGIHQHLTGKKFSMGQSLSRGLGLFFPILGASILVSFMTGLATLLLFVPGLIVMCMFWVVVPALVVEQQGIGKALDRSRELTTGNRWNIFGITILLGLINGAVVFASSLLTIGLTGFGTMGQSTPESPAGMLLVLLLLVTIISALSAGLQASVVTVGYYALRRDVDGLSDDELAAVFD